MTKDEEAGFLYDGEREALQIAGSISLLRSMIRLLSLTRHGSVADDENDECWIGRSWSTLGNGPQRPVGDVSNETKQIARQSGNVWGLISGETWPVELRVSFWRVEREKYRQGGGKGTKPRSPAGSLQNTQQVVGSTGLGLESLGLWPAMNALLVEGKERE